MEHSKSGFGALEIIIGAAIIAVSLFGLMTVSQISLALANQSNHRLKAAFLLEEAIEAIKILRDAGWADNIAPLNVGSPYYFDFNGSSWQSTTTNIYVDGFFERSFLIEDVYRDANDDISDFGFLDPGAKKASVFVSFKEKSGTTTKSISVYITNLFNN